MAEPIQFETYVTVEGDSVDLIAFNRFGTHGAEAAIFAANPGLAAMGPVLPLGLTVVIPLPEVKDRGELQNIWSVS